MAGQRGASNLNGDPSHVAPGYPMFHPTAPETRMNPETPADFVGIRTHGSEVAIADRDSRMPAQRPQDRLGREVPPLERPVLHRRHHADPIKPPGDAQTPSRPVPWRATKPARITAAKRGGKQGMAMSLGGEASSQRTARSAIHHTIGRTGNGQSRAYNAVPLAASNKAMRHKSKSSATGLPTAPTSWACSSATICWPAQRTVA